MKRQIVYPGAVPLETDLLNTNRNILIALAKFSAALLGTSTIVNGLACTPTGPASLQVYVAPGEIYSLQNLDGTAYSSLAADTTHAIMKQGILLDQATLSCPAPVTVGQSVNYLIQATYQDVDGGATVLPYYNASNPTTAYSGPANSGTAQNTYRDGVCTVTAKAGVAATTGSQTTPAPDAGYIGLFVVTVAYGQTQITAPNIAALSGAPFLPAAGLVIGGLQGNACNISTAGGTADAITGVYTPGITALTNGMTLYVRGLLANATTTPTFTPNSGTIPAKTVVKGAGAALAAGDFAGAGHWAELQYDATLDKWVLLNPATGVSAASVASVQGSFKNLVASATGTTAVLSVSADELVVENAAHAYLTLRSLALTASTGSASGVANSLDTGAWAYSTWYNTFVIWNGTTAALLWSLSATAPTLPSGYTYFARVGTIRTPSATNYNPLGFQQYGRRVQYKVAAGSNVTGLPAMASGTVGSVTTPSYSAVGVSGFVPPTAATIKGVVDPGTTLSGIAIVAPNGSYGAYTSTTNPPPAGASSAASTSASPGIFEFALESTSIYWASNSAMYLFCIGWEDNI